MQHKLKKLKNRLNQHQLMNRENKILRRKGFPIMFSTNPEIVKALQGD